MFKVNTDKEFFNKFKELEIKIIGLSTMFQNPDIEISAEEYGNWNTLSKQVKKDLDMIIKESNNRIISK
jgi:hypothetical protein